MIFIRKSSQIRSFFLKMQKASFYQTSELVIWESLDEQREICLLIYGFMVFKKNFISERKISFSVPSCQDNWPCLQYLETAVEAYFLQNLQFFTEN